ncbi:hypothetical protein [Winogradskyella sp. PE311]|uniref:hypothetical protein n=1 Tax=Winogradskyella sp. PE311 TaxID=3366943 RepID=UPI003981461A
MKKIIYFDNWDKGYRNFLRLDQGFKSKDYETLLIHTASLTNPEVKKEYLINGLKLRDISFYKTIRIKKVIKKEGPSAIIMLNLSFILDRVIVQICKDLDINVYYLAHGKLVSIDSVKEVKENLDQKGLISKINKKNIFSTFNYILGLKNPLQLFVFIKKLLTNPTEFIVLPKYSEELNVNKCFVYYQSDFDLMTKEFGFPRDKIDVVGNPELDVFYNSEIKSKKVFCINELGVDDIDYVAYLDDGLSSIHNWDDNKWLDFLKDINNILLRNDLKLIIKTHPRRDIKSHLDFFESNNITVIKDLDFKNFLHHSKFVISHFSSVIIYALLLNKKVKSPRWGVSNGLVEQYPNSVVDYYDNSKVFEDSIFNCEVDTFAIKHYIESTIGKVDGKSVERIVNGIIK